MMEVNVLNITQERLLEWMPEHFTQVEISDVSTHQINKISSWIYKNFTGRYCIVNGNNYNSIVYGFESGSEASFFQLIYPTIK